jgi:5-methylcytosine-specific restriction endonuclease McrA
MTKINKKKSTDKPKKAKGPRKTKEKIPKALKDLVWKKFYSKLEGVCICCGLNKITTQNYEAGHIIAESKGGKTDINNLAPVCSTCNKSMGSKNMREFMEKNFNRNYDSVMSGLQTKKIVGGVISFVTNGLGIT